MKILIDECLPRKLKHELPDHEVKTVPDAGWAGKKNGTLLRLMAGVFDVLITIDNNLENQQQLASQPAGFIVLRAANNKFSTLLPLMPRVREALTTLKPGQVIIIRENNDE
jgi:predicted nuclease of predicted toxin-antitoxin system